MVLDMTQITFKNLKVRADQRIIIDIPEAIINLSNGITALIGPNGSGKTTLLKLIHQLIEPTDGHLSIDVETALVFHDTPLIKASVRTNLTLLQGSHPEITESAIDQVLEQFGLADFRSRVATKLSAGEKQKLCIARAKLLNAPLILLDEPTSNLDPNATEQIEDLIATMSSSGTKFIIATHDLGFVRRIANQVVMMSNGTILENTSANHFFSGSIHPSANHFIKRQLGINPSAT